MKIRWTSMERAVWVSCAQVSTKL